MKIFFIVSLAFSISVYAQTGAGPQGSGYAPNNGTSQPGNPGTFATPKAGLGGAAPVTTGRGTDIDGAGTMGTGASPSTGMNPSRSNDVLGTDLGSGMESGNAQSAENLEKANTSANPIPTDTTLQNGKTQTGPYKTPGNKQSQESTEEELDYRAIPKVDHNDQNASENQ